MLDPAQIAVCGDHRFGDAGLDTTGGGQRIERVARCTHPERRVAAAPDELLGLGEKLDLADAATPQLDVVAVNRDGVAAVVGVDLTLDRVDVANRREIEVLAPDERHQRLDEGLADGAVTGYRARLDHRRALPVLTE